MQIWHNNMTLHTYSPGIQDHEGVGARIPGGCTTSWPAMPNIIFCELACNQWLNGPESIMRVTCMHALG
jgi:hypothetical protein